MQQHLFVTESKVDYATRKRYMGQEPVLIWFTGLSGSGKSTLATGLEHYLFQAGYKSYLLDGDNIRRGLNKDLDFSLEGRTENIRRIGEVAALMLDAGLIVVCSFISPLHADRGMVRTIVGADRFIEIYVECSLEICEERDVKGLYKKARKGEISNFTGISSPYEVPQAPALVVHTGMEAITESLQKVIDCVHPKIAPVHA
jgi:adenylyl-sulfate kinase